jgi:anaphase-promoting complex subunit 5
MTDSLQGESIATAFENIAKAAHLNVTKATTNVTGPILIMKAAVFSRVGLARLAWSSGEAFLECHSDEAPAEDLLKCRSRMASLLVQQGRYREATALMEAIPQHILRVLKYQQYWTFFAGLLQLRRHLHRSDLDAASYLLDQLKGQGAPDVEVGFALSLLEVDLLMRRGVYNEALDLVESLAQKMHPETADVYSQVKLLMIKARGLALSKHPLKGFSIAVRAANMSHRARILPALWESSGILAHILISLHEFSAAVDVLEAIVPQVLECEDCDLAARTYALLVDGYMGLGGEEEPESVKREERVNKAMEYIDAAFAQFHHVEDLRGQCDILAKKATILNLRGDLVLANDCASQYLGLKQEYAAARL